MQHSRENMVRAVMEGVALNTNWVLQSVRKFLAGYPVDEITLVGGGGASDAWCRIFADVMNVTIRQHESPIQANVIGSAFIAGVGLGELAFTDVPERVRYRNVYRPDPANRQIYDGLADTFDDVRRSLAPFYRRLNSKSGVRRS